MVTAAFGVKRNRRWLRYLLKTDFNKGTFQKDLVTALRKFDFKCAVRSFTNIMPSRIGIKKLLNEYLHNGYLAIACVDSGDHWIVIRALRGDRVYVADPDWTAPKYHSLTKFYERVKNGSIVFVKRKQ